MGGGFLHDPGVPPRLLEEDVLEQGSQGQVGTNQVDTVREGIRWRAHHVQNLRDERAGVSGAACSPERLEPQL